MSGYKPSDLESQGGDTHVQLSKPEKEQNSVTITYGEKDFELVKDTFTGAQLAAIFGVPTGYKLDLIKNNDEFDEINSEDEVKIKDGMHFTSHPPSGQSS